MQHFRGTILPALNGVTAISSNDVWAVGGAMVVPILVQL